MNLHVAAGIVAGILGVSASIPYVWGIFRGTVRPNLVSQILWTLVQVIAAAALFSGGVTWPALIVVAGAVSAGIIAVLAAIGYGYSSSGRLDSVCFGIALLAIILWQSTHQPLIAVACAILADFLATIPTLAKDIRDPRSDPPLAWGISTLAATLALCSIEHFSVIAVLYPVFLILQAGTLFAITFFGRMRVGE
jgi:hypothetical protein